MTRPTIANLPRLAAHLERERYDAIVVRSPINFTYLAGLAFPGTLGRHLELADSPRPVFVVWPRDGAPAVIVNPLGEALTRRDGSIERVIGYNNNTDDPYAVLVDTLRTMGVAKGRIGYEDDWFSPSRFATFAQALPDATLTDCTRMLEAVRWIKTPGEIALIKRAADVLDEAFLEVFPTIRDGETERAVHARLVAACMQRGASFAHGWMASNRNTVPAGGQSDFAFRAGDVVRTDYVAYVDGYPGHQSRNAVLGRASAEQAAMYARMRDLYLRTIDHCRPGRTAGDVFAFARKSFEAAHLPYRVVLCGHSVGCWWHQQQPLIVPGNDTPLEAGMILALEPYYNEWITQDLVLVQDGAPKLLSDRFPTATLFEIR
ncbi:MAG: aminopeptidase P family protein [Rhizobiales bacterium]|nr:aminopeptidase P family protein [Hyphomicrobiales bacterium]